MNSKIPIFLKVCYSFTWQIFLIILYVSLYSCNSKKSYSIITFSGEGACYNNSKSNTWTAGRFDSIHPCSILAEKGDLLFLKDDILYFTDEKETHFSVKSTLSLGYINNKLNSIAITKEKDLLPWFKQMKDSDILNLHVLAINDSLLADYYPYIDKIAKIKPAIGLVGDVSDISPLLKKFTPSFLILENPKSTDFAILSDMSKLEILYITLDDTAYTSALPPMPSLKQLIISEMSQEKRIGDEFLKNNPQIERLVCITKDSINLSFVKPIKDLKHLSICGFSALSGFSFIEKYNHLEVLCLIGGKFLDFSVLNNFKSLRWLTLPVNTTQEQFKSIVENHPDLEVIEFVKNENINDFSPLKQLKKLYGITVTDTLTDFNTVTSLKQLKFLSLPYKVYADSLKRVTLKKSLPKCTITANEGFCLGSGWLLLCIPLIIVFVCLLRKGKLNG